MPVTTPNRRRTPAARNASSRSCRPQSAAAPPNGAAGALPHRLSLDEETANAATHAGGLVLSAAGAVALLEAVRPAEAWLVTGCGIYATSLVAVYAASTLSHLVREPGPRRWFRALDQGAIHLVIAGTFTPFALAHLSQDPWWLLLVVMWAAAVAGFCAKVLWKHRTEAVSIASYLLLGWLPILAAGPILQAVPLSAAAWILGGGFCYSLGAVFLAFDHRVRYFHAVWHLSVIAGSACHYFVILRWVVAPGR